MRNSSELHDANWNQYCCNLKGGRKESPRSVLERSLLLSTQRAADCHGNHNIIGFLGLQGSDSGRYTGKMGCKLLDALHSSAKQQRGRRMLVLICADARVLIHTFAMTALLPPAAQPRRGDQNLQPVGIISLRSLSSLLKFSTQHYFTSTLFVEPMRADISDLLKAYIERCKVALNAKEDPKPFEWFKTIWRERKWNLLHLRCIQPRPRKAFLEVTIRLFLGISKHVLSSY